MNIAKEERKILIARRKLESIRLLSELIDRVKVSWYRVKVNRYRVKVSRYRVKVSRYWVKVGRYRVKVSLMDTFCKF